MEPGWEKDKRWRLRFGVRAFADGSEWCLGMGVQPGLRGSALADRVFAIYVGPLAIQVGWFSTFIGEDPDHD